MAGPTDTPHPCGHPASGALRILLVEDSVLNQKLMSFYLGRLGHTWDLATTGEEAVHKAIESAYDVILMDVQMEGMNGLEATRRIRQKHGKDRPWIVGVTTDGLDIGRETCLEAGMDAFLAKPFLLQELEEVLARRPDGPTVAGRPASGGDEPVRFRDLETLRERLGPGGQEAVLQLAATYLESSGTLAASLSRHARQRERVPLQRDAHTLKSASAAVGAHDLASLCRGLEEELAAAADPEPWQTWNNAVDGILKELARVRDALEHWSA